VSELGACRHAASTRAARVPRKWRAPARRQRIAAGEREAIVKRAA